MRVEPARVWQDPNDRLPDPFLLFSNHCFRLIPRRSISAQTQYRQKSGPVSANFLHQSLAARAQLLARQLVSSRRGASDHIRYSVAVLQQLQFIKRRNESIGETRCEQGRPKSITRSGEVMANRSGVKAGIDAAEEHAQIGPNHIGHGFAGRVD